MKTFPGYKRTNISLLFMLSLLVISTFPSYAELPVIKDGDSLASPFTKVYEKVAPSVVKINVESKITVNSTPWSPWNDFFNIPKTQDNVERKTPGMGSGVIVDREGHIITNNHVIQNPSNDSVADKIIVKINDAEEYPAEVIGRDPESDLAVIKLKLEGKKLPQEYVSELGDSDSIKPGDYAVAIGNPIGLERTITVGVISAVGRHNISPYGADKLNFQNFIQTDAQINPGNSGGALADINGKIIGINNMYAQQFAGIGFAIPINLARNVMNQIIETGVVKRGAVGIKIGEVTKEFQEALELPDREGVFIHEVYPGTPAEKAGLEKRDVIISLNGEKMKNENEFLLKVGDLPPGEKIRLGIIHDGKIKTLTLTLADRDKIVSNFPGNTADWRGIHVVDITSSWAEEHGLGDIDRGVIIVKIDQGSPASEADLRKDDVIVEINETQVDNIDDFLKIKKGNEEESRNRKKPILVYRLRKLANGRTMKNYIAVKPVE